MFPQDLQKCFKCESLISLNDHSLPIKRQTVKRLCTDWILCRSSTTVLQPGFRLHRRVLCLRRCFINKYFAKDECVCRLSRLLSSISTHFLISVPKCLALFYKHETPLTNCKKGCFSMNACMTRYVLQIYTVNILNERFTVFI